MYMANNEKDIIIRDVRNDDAAFVLDLNEVNVEVLSPMDEARFRYFKENSEMFQVAEVGGEHGGGYHSATVGHDGES